MKKRRTPLIGDMWIEEGDRHAHARWLVITSVKQNPLGVCVVSFFISQHVGVYYHHIETWSRGRPLSFTWKLLGSGEKSK